MAKPKPFEPWATADLSLPEVAAIKAVATGTASEDQQRRFMRTLIERICKTYEETYCPGVNGERDSAYAQGMRRVGTMLVSFISADIDKFRDEPARHEPGK